LDFTPTRRGLGAAALGALAAACTPAPQATLPPLRSRQFPDGFRWGVSTAAFQIEGALDADGRGKSIWDVFPAEKIVDRSNASLACDSYRRYAEDAALIADASLKAYRFSIAWSRILPEGKGAVNQKGLDYYARLAETLAARNIAPYATLFHWDLPLALHQAGGWRLRDTAQHFADYAALIGARLSDRIGHFIILNEAPVHVIAGHVLGMHAPGLNDDTLVGPATHHLNLAQGLACQALRAARSGLEIGTSLALTPSRAAAGLPFLNQAAADGFDEIWNRAWLDPLFNGAYPKAAQDFVEPHLRPRDLETIRQPLDFIGVNYYAPAYMRFDWASEAHIASGEPPEGVERDAFGRHVDPAGLFQALARLRTDYANPRVIVTENGCSDPFSDGPAIIDDRFRIDYLRRHLEAVRSAMEAGSRIEGYFHWTLVDNWEWAEGYRSKFGLVAMDRASGVRTSKSSYSWFKSLAGTGILDA
jgi:beta-glucosidase